MKLGIVAGVVLMAGLGGYLLLSSAPKEAEVAVANEGGATVAISMPETLGSNAKVGERLFNAKCVACHGETGVGVEGSGPPLVHKIYEPSHHADEAFQRAVQQGVRAHHWGFGDMPPVEGLTRGDVKMIVTYIREIQRENGIL